MQKLTDKVAIITGASRGLGKAMAVELEYTKLRFIPLFCLLLLWIVMRRLHQVLSFYLLYLSLQG